MERMNPRNGSTAKYAVLLVLLLGLGAALGLMGCSGGGSSNTTPPPPTVTLTSISVSPLNATMDSGGTMQFFATANYSDKTTQNVTKSATWTSSDATTATVQSTGEPNPGLVAGVAVGSVTIRASYNGKNGATTLTLSSNANMHPLTDMTPVENYLGNQGGLYENVTNTVPADHDAVGLATAATIQPLDVNGNPSPSGKIVFISIGRSNAEDEFNVFVTQAAANAGVNHATLVIKNGALTGTFPCVWTVPSGDPPCAPGLGNQYDRIRDTILAPLGLSEKQVQVTWIEEYDADPASAGFQTLCDPSVAGCSNDVSHTEALRFEQQLGDILRAAKTRWPNLKQAFNSSPIYGGYSTTNHRTEPYQYEYSFSIKWLVDAQVLQMRSGGSTIDPIAGDLNYNTGKAPWTVWGPYLWANGDTPRSDGLVWCNGQAAAPCSGEVDYELDGTHPNTKGKQKVAGLLMSFFLGSPYTAWFRV